MLFFMELYVSLFKKKKKLFKARLLVTVAAFIFIIFTVFKKYNAVFNVHDLGN